MSEYGRKRHELGFIQVDPIPTDAELQTYYREKYYQAPTSATYSVEYSAEEKTYIRNRARVAEYVLAGLLTERPKKTIADIGCGEGLFVGHFLREGWEIRATDFSVAGVERQSPDVLPYFAQGDSYSVIAAWLKEGRRFDVVNLGNILEHVRDPLRLLSEARNLLQPAGILRVAVPNDFSKLQQELTKREHVTESWFCPPDHLSYFNFDTLPSVLTSAGFSLADVLTDFPIEVFLFNRHSNYVADGSLGKAAHGARLAVDNFLVEQGLKNYVEMMAGAARCNFGRTVIAYARKT